VTGGEGADIFTPCAGSVGMLLRINGKFSSILGNDHLT
jgi:hypothetical protein